MKKHINGRIVLMVIAFAALGFAEFQEAEELPEGYITRYDPHLLSIIYFLIAALITFILVMSSVRAKTLVRKGRCVRAEFISLEAVKEYRTRRTNYTLNLMYENPENGIVYKFKTEISLRYDPTAFLRENGLPVYMDSDKPWKYYVDVTELIELSEKRR